MKCLMMVHLQQTRGWIHLPEHKIQLKTEEQKPRWTDILNEFEKANGQVDLGTRYGKMHFAIDESIMRNFMYKAGKPGPLSRQS